MLERCAKAAKLEKIVGELRPPAIHGMQMGNFERKESQSLILKTHCVYVYSLFTLCFYPNIQIHFVL